MSCPDPYRPYNPFEPAPDSDAERNVYGNLPSDAEVRSLASALAANGGGASSEDLALDLVLNQIVEQACLATGATGAAIALTRDGEMVCRATTGRTAPDLGVRLDNAGFSAECLRVGMLQRCDDTETDPRVDAAACRLLGVRSILVVPLWYWGEFMGIFEIFSTRPNAFGERDEQTLQALAYRIVRHTKQTNGQLAGFSSVEQETAPLQVPIAEPAPRNVMPVEPDPEPGPVRQRPRAPIFELRTPSPAEPPVTEHDPVTTIFAALAAFVACLIIALMAYRVFTPPPTAAQKTPPAAQPQEIDLSLAPSSGASVATPAEAAPAAPGNQVPAQNPNTTKSHDSASAADVVVSAANKKNLGATAPAPAGGGLAIYDEHGKLIYGSPIHSVDDTAASKPKKSAPAKSTGAASATPAAKSAAGGKTSAAENSAPDSSNPGLIEGRYIRLKPDLAESLLDDRVEPEYPDSARRAHIQGAVILETLIGANGKVQEVTPVSGPPQLAEAAATAVRQWKYKPFTVDGQKVPIRTQVTVTFMLAQ